MIDLTFDDPQAPPPILSPSLRRPKGWTEDARMDGWRGRLRPSNRAVWVIALSTAFLCLRIGLRAAARMAPVPVYAVMLGLFLAVAVYASIVRKRPWSFAFENERFVAESGGTRHDLALADVLRFSAAETDLRKAPKHFPPIRLGAFELLAHHHGRAPSRIPLVVDSPEEAQFIADRANALLASDGRSVDHGYRGERVRVAVEPAARAMPEFEASEQETDRQDALRQT